MKISKIQIFQLDIPLIAPHVYPHKIYESLDDTIVKIETDQGVSGWGEVCPLSSTYQPTTAAGVRTEIGEMAQGLIGEDPTQTDRINCTMNKWLLGGAYAKSAIDIACWDIVGKAYGKPLYHLLGGRLQDKAKAYSAVGMGAVDDIESKILQYRNDGYSHFMVKVGRNSSLDNDIARIKKAGECIKSGEVLVADANKAWTPHEAIRILRTTEDVDFYIEQPCKTYEECVAIRQKVRQPIILDESMMDIKMVLRALADNSFEGIGCKVTRVGGITGMRQIRDICTAAGKFMTVDDAWGADLSAAVQAHLSVSTPASTFFATYISTCFSNVRYDNEAPIVQDGCIQPNEKPGLGVEPDSSIIGEPMHTYT